MSLIHNERVKLLANALDRASTACVAVGVVGPAAAFLYGMGTVPVSSLALGIGSSVWLGAAVTLHCFARRTLGGLK
ncbi:1,4-dihydroxy-2-naphthoate octaprenyltransferase [Azospirillum fermentarium]|uniref:hypothetical protein n=1 Tax=Azospirillum fermentarium TaxID=1233114 RepID=UPI002227760F|nr:hypothetical protein [Azospirillum fermentarium]MCW2247028.1 1,4-dihydroxy-2-naphthoate octaprenyltransferase [Azospirillum fermentarium]